MLATTKELISSSEVFRCTIHHRYFVKAHSGLRNTNFILSHLWFVVRHLSNNTEVLREVQFNIWVCAYLNSAEKSNVITSFDYYRNLLPGVTTLSTFHTTTDNVARPDGYWVYHILVTLDSIEDFLSIAGDVITLMFSSKSVIRVQFSGQHNHGI